MLLHREEITVIIINCQFIYFSGKLPIYAAGNNFASNWPSNYIHCLLVFDNYCLHVFCCIWIPSTIFNTFNIRWAINIIIYFNIIPYGKKLRNTVNNLLVFNSVLLAIITTVISKSCITIESDISIDGISNKKQL